MTAGGNHPYQDAPDERYWRKAVALPTGSEVDPAADLPFRISPTDAVVTAGSCFAQHISRRLRDNGYAFLVTETAHPILPAHVAKAFNYGVFSARYGNIYTSRQLLQLIQRAYGRFTPSEDCWEQEGRWFDPFRPQIQPGGFASRIEYDLDRRQHLAAVRHAFESLDVLVFTLGLTECWVSSDDGAAFPVCPGTAAGTFDPQRHRFLNLGVDEVVADMNAFFDVLSEVNPRARTILTVSPVPLVATAEDRHVLVSTTYSKSVLRVAAEALTRRPGVFYFPSYEIITGPHSRGRYFAEDLRSVTEAGVDHVMRVFFRHATEGAQETPPEAAEPEDSFVAESRAIVDALCDEERLDAGLPLK